jgi:hypothetical protein
VLAFDARLAGAPPALLEALWEAIDRLPSVKSTSRSALAPQAPKAYPDVMATVPLPQVVAVPCTKCGEEAIVQMLLVVEMEGGVRMEAKVIQQCGCGGMRSS